MKEKKFMFIFLIMIIFSFSWSFQNFRREDNEQRERQNRIFQNKTPPFRYDGPLYASDEVLVKFNPSLSEQSIQATIASFSSKESKRIPRIDVYKLQIPKDVEVMEMVSLMRQNPAVEYAEPNHIVRILVTPNDALFRYQYALFNESQYIGVPGSPQGKPRADIKATEGWEETKGDEEVIIAVIDTGVDLHHPDLSRKILHGGQDFINGDFDATDDHSHGTQVAGVAAADTNNYEGIAGVAWNSKILPVKVFDADGESRIDIIVEGIIWAVDNEADVMNLSFGARVGNQALEEAVQYAYESDVVVVAAAGNDGGAVLFPAAYDNYCLAVAATNNLDERVTFQNSGGEWESNFGPEVDVAAPGQDIFSTVPTWFLSPGSLPYEYKGGTSMATPHVAGLAALIKSVKSWLTAEQIMDIIRFSADDVNSTQNPGQDEFLGYGRINMEKALVPIIITTSN